MKTLKFLQNNRILLFVLLPFVAYGIFTLYQQHKTSEIYAVDPLVVTYNGDSPPDPMFVVSDMLPGDSSEKVFNVENGGPQSIGVLMDGIKTQELKAFAGILDVEITELPANNLFTGKLQDFFNLNPMSLGSFSSGEDRDYKIKINFPESAGNEYQGAKVVFNIKWTTSEPPIDLPAECAHLAGSIESVIEGTEGNDNIRGNHEGNLILAKGGNDVVNSGAGPDCVVLGDADDKTDTGSGNDVVVGGLGVDKIDSGAGKDIVYAGDGNDWIDGGSGDDLLYGENGDDEIYAASGDDEVYAGAGNDYVKASSGKDKVYGEAGNDTLYGDPGTDFLDGGVDIDKLFGGTSTDTCVNGETLNSCEL